MRGSLSGDKLNIALFGDLSLEEAMELSRDRQILELEKGENARYLSQVNQCQKLTP
jgi:hypothetical protein